MHLISPASDAALTDALHRVWGFSDFRPLQREAMHAVLDRRDSVVVLPTGGGKSLCFQAPAIDRVRRDIISELRLRDPIELVGSFDRPNLTYRVLRRGGLRKQIEAIL